MTRTRSPWSKSIGERGQRVRLYEARPGGPIMRSTWINGKEDRKSLGHRDRELATRQAYELLQGVLANEQAGRGPGVESSLLKIKGSQAQQMLQELKVEMSGYYAYPWQTEQAVGPVPFKQSLANYNFGRASTIYGGSTEVQYGVMAKAILGL